MRICVYGAGAIGGHLAVRYARGGADVSVLARGPHLAAIQRDGLIVHTSTGELRTSVRASDDPVALGPQGRSGRDSESAVAAGGRRRHRATAAPRYAGRLRHEDGIPWWYFHALPGSLEGRRLPRIDSGRCAVACGRTPSGRSAAWSMRQARSSHPA